jgi:hypothetical protein
MAVSCTIQSNNIVSPALRELVGRAVCEAIGERPGEWKVTIYQAPDYPAFAIRVEGPNEWRWNWTVHDSEQKPEFIRQRVAQGIATKLSLEANR